MTVVVDVVKRVGALPVIKRCCERLGLVPIVNEHLPLAPQAPVGRGETLAALIINKLTAPHPLYRVTEWAERWGAEPVLGIHPSQLTDDRIGRLLDELAEQVEPLKAAICLAAIEAFGLEVGRFHWDLTTLHFEGDYDGQHPLWPLLTYGYDPRGSGEHKQVRVANLVLGDGAVGGLLHKTYPGNRSDVDTVSDYIALFCQIRDRYGKQPRLIGDSKLLSKAGMVKLEEAGLQWLCPEPHTSVLDQMYLELPPEKWVPLDYVSRREALLPAEGRTQYRGQEVSFEVTVKTETTGTKPPPSPRSSGRRGKPTRTCCFRRLFIFSTEELKAQRTNRERQRTRLETKLGEQAGKFQSRFWRRQPLERAQRAVERIMDSSTAGRLYRYHLERHPEDLGWSLRWDLDVAALEAAERLDGYYTLVTNIPLANADLGALFRDYKAQYAVERRFADWKGALKVRPMFLKSNKRIVGLVLVLSLALLIFCLIEREVRRQLAEENESMEGLLPVRRKVRATGWNILNRLSDLDIVGIRVGGQYLWQAPPATPVQQRLLHFLDVDLDQMLNTLPGPKPRPP